MININPNDAKKFLINNSFKSCCVKETPDQIDVYYDLTGYYMLESVTSYGEKDYQLLTQEEFHSQILKSKQ